MMKGSDKKNTGISLRKAKSSDKDILYEWRNHSDTRSASLNTRKISRAEHESWFNKSLANPDRSIYIAEENGCPIGTVRADCYTHGIELSWTVAPEHKGRGVGKRIVSEAASRITEPLRAKIKTGNIASVRIAEYAGMKKKDEIDGVLFYSRKALK